MTIDPYDNTTWPPISDERGDGRDPYGVHKKYCAAATEQVAVVLVTHGLWGQEPWVQFVTREFPGIQLDAAAKPGRLRPPPRRPLAHSVAVLYLARVLCYYMSELECHYWLRLSIWYS
jgi:hypothetical protein